MKVYLIAMLLLCASPPAWADKMRPKEVSEFQGMIKKQVAATQTLTMEIVQERALLAFEDKLVSKGRFFLAQPDKVRWQIDSPYKSAIVYSKNVAAKFEYRKGKWRKLEHGGVELIKQIMTQISEWTNGNFDKNPMYEAEYLRGGQVVLTPTSSGVRNFIDKMTLQFDSKTFLIRTVTLKEKQGDYVKISFSNPQLNVKIEDKLFAVNEKDAN